MSKELRTAADVAGWLSAGMSLVRVPLPEDEAAVAAAIMACANELPAMPPPGLVADVTALLHGQRLPMLGAIAADDALRAAIHAYDDDVLARLVTTARFDDVLAAFAHLQPTSRAQAVALVVGAICERAGFTGLSVSPATLRRALARPRADQAASAKADLLGANAIRLADAYTRLARGARQSRALVDEREVFNIDHLETLRDFGGRMTADHIQAAAAAIERTLPRRLPSKRDQRGHSDTKMDDDSLYPAGGFASITPGGASTGNIENLVSSELVYMDKDSVVDLFSLRYMEGELLFYTRDDSVFRRHRHLIAIALHSDLDDARVKDRGLPWQRLVLALGWLVAVIRWLHEQLGEHALVIQIAFAPGPLAEEREILSLLLEAEIARGTVVIAEQAMSETIEKAAGASGQIVDAIVLSLGPIPALPKGLRTLHVNLAAAAPAVVELAPRPGIAADQDPDAFVEWCESAEDLLRWLV